MSHEELWRLFPIVLREHDPGYAAWYEEEARAVIRALGADNVARLRHIGSTAVPGLLAKPTVDMLLEIPEACDLDALRAALEAAGWLFAAQPDKPAPHMMFMKGYTEQGFAERVFHLHVRIAGDNDELYFRDYLIENPGVARQYERLKLHLWKRYEHDRDGYTDAKTDFVRRYTKKAKERYTGRYGPVEK